ncbi:unnamed protein product, partial [Ilex paraguariensis]
LQSPESLIVVADRNRRSLVVGTWWCGPNREPDRLRSQITIEPVQSGSDNIGSEAQVFELAPVDVEVSLPPAEILAFETPANLTPVAAANLPKPFEVIAKDIVEA